MGRSGTGMADDAEHGERNDLGLPGTVGRENSRCRGGRIARVPQGSCPSNAA
jgi:hypothetical protein